MKHSLSILCIQRHLNFKATLILLFSLLSIANAQIPNIDWQKSLGGTNDDIGQKIRAVSSGGFITLSSTASTNGDAIGAIGGFDVWVIRTNELGDTLWTKRLGGSENDFGFDLICVENGNFLIAGQSNSTINGTINKGETDGLLIKLSANGDVIWTKLYGGTGADILRGIVKTDDNKYIAAGASASNNGDLTGTISKGGLDFWVQKMDTSGTIIWAKKYGGSGDDIAYGLDVYHNPGQDMVVAGQTTSTDGDIKDPKGLNDYLIIKIGGDGTIYWSKNLGGSNQDLARGISIDKYDNIVVIGQSFSNDGDVQDHKGTNDYWVVSLVGDYSNIPTINWKKSFGGTGEDRGQSIVSMEDGGLILAGFSNSIDGDVSNNYGSYDCWLIKIFFDGTMIWQKSFGGTGDDRTQGVIPISNNGYAMAAYSTSNNVDLTNNKGSIDVWLVKFKAPTDCIPAFLNSIQASTKGLCSGFNDTLRVSNSMLNAASNWGWYEDSLNGKLIGIGDSIIVSPVGVSYYLQKIYYAKALDNCANALSAALIKIGVSSLEFCTYKFVFTGNGQAVANWKDTANWLNRIYPGISISSGHTIDINGSNPLGTTCIVDTSIIFNGKLNVKGANSFTAKFTSTSASLTIDSLAYATLNIDGFGTTILNKGNLKLTGNFKKSSAGISSIDNRGSLTFSGKLIECRLNNYGDMLIPKDSICLFGVGFIEFSNQLNNYKNLLNEGTISGFESQVYSSGSFTNKGVITIYRLRTNGNLTNYGSIDIHINYPSVYYPYDPIGIVQLLDSFINYGSLLTSGIDSKIIIKGNTVNKGILSLGVYNPKSTFIELGGNFTNDSSCYLEGQLIGNTNFINNKWLGIKGLWFQNTSTTLTNNDSAFIDFYSSNSTAMHNLYNLSNKGKLIVHGSTAINGTSINNGTIEGMGFMGVYGTFNNYGLLKRSGPLWIRNSICNNYGTIVSKLTEGNYPLPWY